MPSFFVRARIYLSRALRWLTTDFPKAPGFAIYARHLGEQNKRTFRQVRTAVERNAAPSWYEEGHYGKQIPKIIWLYWAQGEYDAPFVVRRCFESWRSLNPGWEVRVLDEETANTLVDLSDVSAGLPRRFRANVLRLRLLKKKGGVWTDATTLCHRPLDDWLPLAAASGFFAFSNPGIGRWIDNWFIASEPDGALISAWEPAYSTYLMQKTEEPDYYFMQIYCFQWAVKQARNLQQSWAQVVRIPAQPTFLLMSALRGQVPVQEVKNALASGLPLSKLSWKVDVSPEDVALWLGLGRRSQSAMISAFKGLLKGDGYQARAIRGTGLTVLNTGGQNALRLASNLILTRLLFPEAFGMMALVQLVIAGAAMFSDLGFRGAVVQDPRGNQPEFLNTVWTLQIVRGVILMTAIMLAAGPLAAFWEEPQLAGLLMLAAFSPLIQGFNSTRILTADRELQLGRTTMITLGSQIITILATAALAWWLQSVWALVIGGLVGTTCIALTSHLFLKGHPNRLFFELRSAKSLIRYGAFIFIASVGGFFSQYGDRAILGKFVSLEILALYHIAMLLASVPTQLSTMIGGKVLFPLYARRPPAESAENRRKINKARRLVVSPLLLIAGFFAFVGDDVVRLLYDERYENAGPYLVLIALSIMPQMITRNYQQFPLAAGHSGRFAAFQIVSGSVRIGLMLLMVPTMGVLGAIIAVPLSVLIMYPAMIYMILPYKGWDPVQDAGAFAFAAAITLCVIWLNGEAVAPLLDQLF
jgi:O-antigen/teichoic acid export membrane protein